MIALLLSLILQTTGPATMQADAQSTAQPKPAAEVPLAVAVWKAHGGPAWDQVDHLQFTFKVDRGDENVASVQHDWNVRTGIDRITNNGKTTEVDMYSPADSDEAKTAMQRWTNDAYWLLAPVKFMDGGVLATELEPANGHDRLLIQFENVGLTPTDKYLYEIDPDTQRVVTWTYMPANGNKSKFAWSGYDTFGPLMLALDHKTDDGFRVYFEDVSVN